jgi:uncharacterized membrane protein YiaA
VIAILLMTVGLWNATMAMTEKGFYAMSFLLSLFGAVAVQKNIRDAALFDKCIRRQATVMTARAD